mmetsp:Transcript_24758/g.38579  ORF Transcript_24758/g.38579 Transcript_24758/m.38579 type:complete len:228 (-) Transcript_24758:114-797(-)
MYLDLAFMSQVPEALYDLKTFPEYLDKRDALPAYRYLYKILQFLQWSDKRLGYPKRRFLLKTPEHLDHFNDLITCFPDARFVYSHRNVLESVPSFLSLIAHGWAVFSDSVEIDHVVKHWLPKLKRMCERTIEFRKENDEKFIDIHYKEFLNDPIDFMKKISRRLDVEFGDEEEKSLDLWIKNNAQHKNGKHIYSAEQFGLTKEEIAAYFAFYSNWEAQVCSSWNQYN